MGDWVYCTSGFCGKIQAEIEIKEQVAIMALTRDFKETSKSTDKREPEFATALLDEAISLLLNEELETARLILDELVDFNIVLSVE
jgi:hypothetical protein